VALWTIRLVFPRPLDRTYDGHQRVIREELEMALHAATVTELKWYFEHRPRTAGTPLDSLTRRFLAKGAEAFSALRFEALYRRWLKHGDVVFEGLTSSVLADALTRGAGRVESVVLPHSYCHLAPSRHRLRPGSRPLRRRKRGVKGPGPALNPRAQPLPKRS
jgi:hypothetical protein